MHLVQRSRRISMLFSSSTNTASSGQIFMQYPQCMHRPGTLISSCSGSMSSGLWHHLQFRGQPLRKTVVLIPGPSSVENFCIDPISASNVPSSIPFRSLRFPAACFFPETEKHGGQRALRDVMQYPRKCSSVHPPFYFTLSDSAPHASSAATVRHMFCDVPGTSVGKPAPSAVRPFRRSGSLAHSVCVLLLTATSIIFMYCDFN